MKKLYLLAIISVVSLRVSAQACSDLFISEYIEGSSHNKVIEIYNPTSGTVDLSHYRLQSYFNGNDTAQNPMTLTGTLSSKDVWIGCNSQADSSILDSADAISSIVINWNGNDAIALINTATGDTLDIFGFIGEDPGSNGWDVTGGTAVDHTLVRNPDVQEGTQDWSIGSTQWTVYPIDDFSHLGAHTMTPCDITIPSLFFTSDTLTVQESDGSFSFTVGIINPNGNATSVDVSVTGGSATTGDDYNFTSPQTITFPANDATPIVVNGTINNDGLSESDESIELSLSNPTNQAIISGGAMKITIVDDDGLGISSSNGNVFSFYPSISHGLFNVSATLPASLHVFDLYGNEVRSIENMSGDFRLDLRDSAHGVYVLQFENKNEIVVKKVLID